MHGVPASEGITTRCCAINNTPDARQTMLQSARRHCRSFAGITRFHIYIYDCGSFHKVAGAIPLSDISAHTCARAFLYHWVSRYGVPYTLTSDRGRQFVSELWRKTAALLGTATNSTTSYHPQSNGMVERMHRKMKAALKAKRESDPNWIDVLPVVMLGMRAAVKQDLNCSAAEMVFGEALRLPGNSSCQQMVTWLHIPRLWST